MEKMIATIRQSLARGQVPTLQDIVSYTNDSSCARNNFFWYENIVSLTFVKEILSNFPKCEEIIIHQEKNIQIKGERSSDRVTMVPQLNLNNTELQLCYEILALKENITWNYKNPFVSFDYTLNDRRFRFSLLHFSCCANQISKLFIRTQYSKKLKLEDMLPHAVSTQLKKIIITRRNILIAGATASGKTTFLKTLLQYCNPEEHIVILEDFHEITTHHQKVTHLLSKEISDSHQLSSYCKYLLRMAPDRVIIGEVRSSEVTPLILSLNTGDRGILTTLHANSALDTITRLSTLFTAYSKANLYYENVEKLVGTNMDIIIYMKDKKVDHIIEVKGFANSKPLYSYIFSRDQFREAV